MDFKLTVRPTGDDDGSVLVRNANEHENKDVVLSADDAMDKIATVRTRKLGVLPPVVRYVSPTGRFILLERPPQVMTFKYYGRERDNIDGAQLQEYDLPLPWTQYAIGLDRLNRPYFTYVFCTPRAIQTLSDILYVLPLPNCEANAKFCTPYPEWGDEEEAWTVSEGINTAYANIWNSNFNTDIISNVLNAYRMRRPNAIFAGKGKRGEVPKGKAPKPSNLFKRWEEFTLEDVSQWIDWVPAVWPDADPVRVENAIVLLKMSERDFNATYLYNTLRQRTMM